MHYRTWMLALLAVCLMGCYSELQQAPIAKSAIPEKPKKKKRERPQLAPRERARERHFEFTYESMVVGLKPGTTARIWVPMPLANAYQLFSLVTSDVPSTAAEYDTKYGNGYVYFEVEANGDGQIPIKLVYNVRRIEMLPQDGVVPSAEDRAKFIGADVRVPANDKPFQAVLKGNPPIGTPDEVARALCNATMAFVSLDKPADTQLIGQGDSDWVCESKSSDSIDIHSLFVALCRGLGIPARMEFGFVLPKKPTEEIGPPRAWVVFATDRWTAADLYEVKRAPENANYWLGHIAPNRIAMSVGRDLHLVPEPAAGPLNYFVYPHVEVDGKPYEQVEHRMSYVDLPEETNENGEEPGRILKRGEE